MVMGLNAVYLHSWVAESAVPTCFASSDESVNVFCLDSCRSGSEPAPADYDEDGFLTQLSSVVRRPRNV